MEQEKNNRQETDKQEYTMTKDEMRDKVEEYVFKDDKEGLEKIRLKRTLKEKAEKGLLSEKEIDNLMLTMLGTDKLKKDMNNQINVKEAKESTEGLMQGQRYLAEKMAQYMLSENDDERDKFINDLKGKVNSPEVAEKNTQTREEREINAPSVEKQQIANNVTPVETPRTIE